MKTPRELDVLRRAVWFEDTPQIVDRLESDGEKEIARHVHKMHIYQKSLIAEIRKLRREMKKVKA